MTDRIVSSDTYAGTEAVNSKDLLIVINQSEYHFITFQHSLMTSFPNFCFHDLIVLYLRLKQKTQQTNLIVL